ncbi:MAG: cytochrome c [Planctomycetes bacterium]|nr:cytochrome c [Planctomycetota bacterium]
MRRTNPPVDTERSVIGWEYLVAVIVGVIAVSVFIAGCQTKASLPSEPTMSPTVSPGSVGYELFQAHCAACHGTNGRGDGIARMALDVAPRDFRNEPFRYVSTMDGIATHDDLVQSIKKGRVHGQMPAGPWLSDEAVNALADYVLELNRLGWVDRLTQEFADDQDMTPRDIAEIAFERVTTEEPIVVAMPSPQFRANLASGKVLFMESCAACHGPSGKGDGLDTPLDELGRPIKVRDLTTDAIQGGSDVFELYKRIRCGIPGTPMPAQPAMTNEQIWQLIFYTRSLMGQPLAGLER